MYDQQTLIGLLAVAVGIIGYFFYYRDIFRGKTKPHPFTWFGFALLNGIIFIAQLMSGGGPGAWAAGFTALATFGIALLAHSHGEKGITLFDWICFWGALIGIALWLVTDDALLAVVTVTVADLLAFAPTFRKSYTCPTEETQVLYLMSALKFGLSLFALTAFTLTTALFPVVVMIANIAIFWMLRVRCQIRPIPAVSGT